MNRQQRRQIEKIYRRSGMKKEEAKAIVDANYRASALQVGQKCKFNYELIIRHPDFKKQKDEFREWVIAHKDNVLTVDEIRNNGFEVTFAEDENENKFWHKVETLIPLASATVKLDGEEDKTIVLDGITSVNDNTINEKN